LGLSIIGGISVSIVASTQRDVTVQIDHGDNLYSIYVEDNNLGYLKYVNNNVAEKFENSIIPDLLNSKNIRTETVSIFTMSNVTFEINNKNYILTLVGVSANFFNQYSWNLTKSGIIRFSNGSLYDYESNHLSLSHKSVNGVLSNNSKSESIFSNLDYDLFEKQYYGSLNQATEPVIIFNIDKLYHISNKFADVLYKDLKFNYREIVYANQATQIHNSLKNLNTINQQDKAIIKGFYAQYFPINNIRVNSRWSSNLGGIQGDIAGLIAYIQITSIPILLISVAVMLMLIRDFQLKEKSTELLEKRGLSKSKQFSLLVSIDFTYLMLVLLISSLIIYMVVESLNLIKSVLINILIMYGVIIVSLFIMRVIAIHINLKDQISSEKTHDYQMARSYLNRITNQIKFHYRKICYVLLLLVVVLVFLKYYLLSKNIIIPLQGLNIMSTVLGLLIGLLFLVFTYYSFSYEHNTVNKNKVTMKHILDRLYDTNDSSFRATKYLIFVSLLCLLLIPTYVTIDLRYTDSTHNGIYKDNSELNTATINFLESINYKRLNNMSNEDGVIELTPSFDGQVSVLSQDKSPITITDYSSVKLYNYTSLEYDSKRSYADDRPGDSYRKLDGNSHNVLLSYDFAERSGIRINDVIDLKLKYSMFNLTSLQTIRLKLSDMHVVGYIKEHAGPGGIVRAGVYISTSTIMDEIQTSNITIYSSQFNILYNKSKISQNEIQNLVASDTDIHPSHVFIDSGGKYNQFLREEVTKWIYQIRYLLYLIFCLGLVYSSILILFRKFDNELIIYLTRGLDPINVRNTIFKKYMKDITFLFIMSFTLSISILLKTFISDYDLFVITNEIGRRYLGTMLLFTGFLFISVSLISYWMIRSKISSYSKELNTKGDIYEFY